MAKYDVYTNPFGEGFLIDVQSDLLAVVGSRVVVPLFSRSEAPSLFRRLNPIFQLGDSEVVMVTQSLAAVPQHILTAPLTNLSDRHDEITDALDMLFQGF